MKKLFLLLSLAALAACSDNPPQEETQDYTSFILKNTASFAYSDVILGYEKEDGTLKLIAELGDIPAGKYSEEIILDEGIESVYAFSICEIGDLDVVYISWIFEELEIKENKKNVYFLPKTFIAAIIPLLTTDPTKYPQP